MRASLALIVALGLAVTARAQILTEMTPERIAEAIAFGTAQKERPVYEIRQRGLMGSMYKPTLGYFSTPFLRVAQGAYSAKKNYQPFTAADVTPDMVAPEVRVYGMAQARGALVSNVQTVVLTPKGARGPEAAIRPASITEIPVEFKNAMGMQAQGKSLMAAFPIDAFRDGYEVHLVYDAGVHNGGEYKFCEDCAVELKLDKVR
jgi:hypothetical protein